MKHIQKPNNMKHVQRPKGILAKRKGKKKQKLKNTTEDSEHHQLQIYKDHLILR